jgi:hypothetical protein
MNRDTFPGTNPRARDRWRVWKGSTTKEVQFRPITKAERNEIWTRAQQLEQMTKKPGCPDGILGRSGLDVLEALLFKIMNRKTGRLDPSYAGIARKTRTHLSARTVARALVRLRDAGIIDWENRCEGVVDEAGVFRLEQKTNAYVIEPVTRWRRKLPPGPPLPDPSCWGATPPLDPIADAGKDIAARIIAYEAEAAAGSTLAAVLARHYRHASLS